MTDPRIICCYVNLHPETERSVKAYAPGVEFMDTSGDFDTYELTVKAAWNGGTDLVVIEQDIEITPDVIESFTNCDRDWCVYSYQGPPRLGYLYHCLGCTKFSAKLQAKYDFKHYLAGAPLWSTLDVKIARLLGEGGEYPHVHGHLNHYHQYVDAESKFCKEMQPDRRKFLYKNNPDGTRGEFVRVLDVEEYHTKVTVGGVECIDTGGCIIADVSDQDKRKWPEVRYGNPGQEAASSSSLLQRLASGNGRIGRTIRTWRNIRRYLSRSANLWRDSC